MSVKSCFAAKACRHFIGGDRAPSTDLANKVQHPVTVKMRRGFAYGEETAPELAHIVQGAEALALDSVLQHYGPRIQLCMHDGWVADHEMNIQEVSTMIFQQTGYRVALEQKRIF